VPPPETDLERLFDALGDRTRRRLVDRLAAAPMSVTSLAEPLGITVTAVAQHLKVLEAAGLVTTEKVGRVRTARLDDRGFRALMDWADARRSGWDRKLDRLAALFDPGPPEEQAP
jgi:DNA-binding transcriptional ArsR family regulator